nr:lysozyme inhibitor LprI family protein [Azospirillum sp. SYSU D00513]
MVKPRPAALKGLLIGAALAALLTGREAGAASFDCAKAQNLDEKLICADFDLSDADERLADSYRRVLKGVDEAQLGTAVRDRLRREQRGWVAQRNRQCGLAETPRPNASARSAMTTCLKERTLARKAVLDRLQEGLPVSALVENRSIKDRQEKDGYEIDVTYPVLDAGVRGAAAFNEAVEKMVKPSIEGFRTSSAEAEAEEDPEFRTEQLSSLSIDHQVTFASSRLLSAQFDFYDFPAGAAHGTPHTSTLHVDLARGKVLTADDVFKAGSGWQKAVLDHCIADLRRQARETDFEFLDGPTPAADGVATSVEDLGMWRLEADRAVILFVPYQLAAYAVGSLEVPVSYALLRPYLKADGPLPPQR